MKIFVAGATGALGVPLVRELVARGHDVSGLTRSAQRGRAIVEAGARPVVADALDREGLIRAITEVRPTHIVHLLTAIPDLPRKASDLDSTNRLRTIGTANLIAAARAVNAERFVAESYVSVYGVPPAHDPCREADSLPPASGSGPWAPVVDALRALEAQVAEAAASGMRSIVLRYGSFYGSRVKSSVRLIELLQRRRLPSAPSKGIMSFVHIDDAASATVQALEHPAATGVYNVADEKPAGAGAFVELAVSALGAPAPLRVPSWVMRLLAPGLASLADVRLALDISRIREALGWRPKYPSLAEGVPATIEEWRRDVARGHVTGRGLVTASPSR